MTEPTFSLHALRVTDLPQNRESRFELRPSAAEMAMIATELGLDGLRKLSFSGAIRGEGKRDWLLTATLGATVKQACVVTLEPVVTRIDEPVSRRFLTDLPDQSGADEVELPDDDTIEPLGSHIDPWAVMIEALALAMPQYPRAEGANLGEANFAEPGIAPMRDEDTKPFAGLAALRDKLGKSDK